MKTLFLLLMLLFGFCGLVMAENCSKATLNGAYGFYRVGYKGNGRLTAVGITNYDGNGNAESNEEVKSDDKLSLQKIHSKLDVHADCTFNGFLDGKQTTHGVIANNGNRIFFLDTTAGNTIYGVAERINQTNCSDASLNGAKAFYRVGEGLSGPLAAVGIQIRDDKGNSESKQRISRNGKLEFQQLTTKAQVHSDCTYDVFLDGVRITRGVIVDTGNRTFAMNVPAGNSIIVVGENINSN